MTTLCIHNALSAYHPRHWWMRPFNFIARCQALDPILLTRWILLNNHDVCFDLRFFYSSTTICPEQPAHGSMIYRWPLGESFDDIISHLSEIADDFPEHQIYIRIILERPGFESAFTRECQCLERFFESNPNVTLFGGVRKKDWKQLHHFASDDNIEARLVQHVSSMASDARWYERFIPTLYARRKADDHQRIITQANDDKIHAFDFLHHLI
ncbi:MAG: hypothetical protein ACI4AM_06425 [Muribaculaceae bacterium]